MEDLSSPKFHQILSELGERHRLKSSEYGTTYDPFANIRDGSRWGEPAWITAVAKLIEGAARSLKEAEGADTRRSIVVTLLDDVASLAIIARILYEEEFKAPGVEHVWSGQPAHIVEDS